MDELTEYYKSRKLTIKLEQRGWAVSAAGVGKTMHYPNAREALAEAYRLVDAADKKRNR